MKLVTKTICLFVLTLPAASFAAEAVIAVATNFAPVAEQLVQRFESTGEHRITLVKGSTGKLYAQVVNGAPFDVLLAADQLRPMLLEDSAFGIAGSRSTYAIGRLALAAAAAEQLRTTIRETLAHGDFKAFVIANPALAPYGVASREVLQSLHLWSTVRDRVVMGENVGQAYALVATGNAELGLVALSLVHDAQAGNTLQYIEVPANLHAPIRQDAVLLAHGQDNPAALAFLNFLVQREARSVVVAAGYAVLR